MSNWFTKAVDKVKNGVEDVGSGIVNSVEDVGSGLGSVVKSGITGVTDAVGLTDSQSAERAAEAARSGVSAANSQLDSDLSGLTGDNGMFTTAQTNGETGASRTLQSNLDNYDSAMSNASSLTSGSANALSSDNVNSYLNPEADYLLDKAAQSTVGSAGSALQSSATTRNTANAVSNESANLYSAAQQAALEESKNNQSVANSEASQANQSLQNDNIPALNWANITSDEASQKYSGQIGVTEADVDAAGTKDTIL